jgi:magnesium transporter
MTKNSSTDTHPLGDNDESHISELAALVKPQSPLNIINILHDEPDLVIAKVLEQLPQPMVLRVLHHLPGKRSQAIVDSLDFEAGRQWSVTLQYPEDSIGRLMCKPHAVFSPETTVRDTITEIRELVDRMMITYGYVVDPDNRLIGLLVMRDLMLANPDQPLSEVMQTHLFSLHPEAPVADAMAAMVRRHYPVYPVCDDENRLIGTLNGDVLFGEYTFHLSAQSGQMVGVEKEEHLKTSWVRSLRMRHPWLQLNLLTAFMAAYVVGIFEDTIAQVVLLAVFLPVLAGQSGNTGCQSLAVTLRGMTLGESDHFSMLKILQKEALLGLFNGILVGITAGAGMFAYATMSNNPDAPLLAFVVFLAMVGSCTISSISGVLVPFTLQRFGADPATASSIFLTTSTDVASMGMFLWLATVLIL